MIGATDPIALRGPLGTPFSASPAGAATGCHPTHLHLRGGQPASATLTTQPQRLLDGQGGYGRLECKSKGQGSGAGKEHPEPVACVVGVTCDCRTTRARDVYASGRLRHRLLTHRSAFADTARRRSRPHRWAATPSTWSVGAS